MKKVLLGTAVLLALLTGCTEEKTAPVQTEAASQEIKKDDGNSNMTTTSNEEIEKEGSIPVLLNPSDEEIEKDELSPKDEEEVPLQDEEPVEQEESK